jgi:hypothetical protein
MSLERVLRLAIAVMFIIIALKMLLNEKKGADWRKRWA